MKISREVDIDTDFNKRDEVIRYLMDKYGKGNVCQIINFNFITPCVAIKDVGKVLGVPYKVTDKISKKFVYENFQENLDNDKTIIEEYAQYTDLFDIASHLSGRVKTVSMHAGGVGIVDTKITDYMAMRCGKDNARVISVDKRVIEEIGIIKFDLLGVATLSVVDDSVKQSHLSLDYFNAHLEKLRKLYTKKAQFCMDLLDKYASPAITYHKIDGGLFIWCDLPESIDMPSFCKEAVLKKVCVVPGNAFLTDENEKCNSFRINFSTPTDEQLEKGIKILGELANSKLK